MAISGLSLNCDRVGGPHLDLWTTGVEPGRSRALDPRLQPHVHESPSSCICGGQRVACTSKYRSEHPPQQPGSGSPPGSTERSSSRGMSRTTARLRPRDECGGKRPPEVKDEAMRFMLLQAYGGVELEGCVPMTEWDPEDVKAHIEFQHTLNAELLDRGELVDAQGLAGPDQAKFVVSDGTNPPKVIDGPYPESKELLAGYRMVDVDSLERALGIAAQSSAAPGPGGVPIRQQIEVRQVMGAPDPDV